MTEHSPTQEQTSILHFVSSTLDNLMIRALAGTGKSATLRMIDQASKIAPALYLVFNTANAKKAEKEFKSSTLVKTFNSIGHKIWCATCAHNVSLNKQKILDIFKSKAEEVSRAEAREMWDIYDVVKAGVDMAREIGYIPEAHTKADRSMCHPANVYSMLDEQPNHLAQELIDEILVESIRQSYMGVIDFKDQCYMPALFGGVFPRFPLVLVDEYQDLTPIQHEMIEKLCKNARQIGVGDDAQAIYAFRGALAGGMTQAINKFCMMEMSLTTSFRCPSAIVENVRWRVPDFQAFRQGGSVSRGGEITDNSTVICRNNAPLLATAMGLIYNGRSVNVAGVDIGDRLIRHMTKLGPEGMTKTQSLDAIEEWQGKREGVGSKMAKDMAACMRVFTRKTESLGAAIAHARHMFSQSGTVNFTSGHKAKGLEWDKVYHLESSLCKDEGQDPNLRYVIDTRSKNELIYI